MFLNIIKKAQLLSLGLIAVASLQAMDRTMPLIEADLQIHADNEVCFVGNQVYKVIDGFGIPRSNIGTAMPAIKVDCFRQSGFDELNWTEGEIKPAFPRYIPLSLVWGLETNSEIDLKAKIHGKKTAIKLYLRDNFDLETGQSCSEQVGEAVDKFVKDASVIQYDCLDVQYFLNLELRDKKLIRQGTKTDEYGVLKYIHNTGLGHKDILHNILNKSKKDEDFNKLIMQDSLSEQDRSESMTTAFPDPSVNLVHLLRNREIGRK
jgi:hypothetical protein